MLNKIYAVARHYQNNDSEGYYQWLGEQILSYHSTKDKAYAERDELIGNEFLTAVTGHASEEHCEMIRSNQVSIFDGQGDKGVYSVEPLYAVIEITLKS